MFLEFERQKNILCTTTFGWKALLTKNISQALSEKKLPNPRQYNALALATEHFSLPLLAHVLGSIVLENGEGLEHLFYTQISAILFVSSTPPRPGPFPHPDSINFF